MSQMRRLSLDAVFALSVLLIQAALSAAAMAVWTYRFQALESGATESIDRSISPIAMLGLIDLLVLIPTVVAFLVWFYRSYKYIHLFHPASSNYRPHAAIWGFFVPILNMFHPIEIALEIWRKLELERPFLLFCWWLPFLFGSMAGNVSYAVSLNQQSGNGALFIAVLSVVSSFFLSIAALFGAVVVFRVSRGREHLQGDSAR